MISRLEAQNAAFLAKLRRGSPPPAPPTRPPAAVVPIAAVAPPPNAIALGVHESNASVTIWLNLLKLIDGRLLIQGISGAGKSYTLRRILEQMADLIQRVVIDPEGEFRSLAEATGMVHVEAHHLDPAALGELARRVRQHRISLVLDLSELEREEQMQAVAAFFMALVDAPREMWHPCLVAVDEAHLFAPFGGQATSTTGLRKAAIGAVVDLMSRGRKRGLVGVLATQRLARLSKSVVSEVSNFLIGQNTLDLDVKRAAETIGWEARKASDRLPLLSPGQFIAVGPAFSMSPAGVAIGTVRSRHIGAAPVLSAPAAIAPEAARRLLELDTLQAAVEAGETTDQRLKPGYRAVRAFIRDSASSLALAIHAELLKLAPDGASIGGLCKHLGQMRPAIVEALALLDVYGAIERRPDSEVVRVHPKFAVSP